MIESTWLVRDAGLMLGRVQFMRSCSKFIKKGRERERMVHIYLFVDCTKRLARSFKDLGMVLQSVLVLQISVGDLCQLHLHHTTKFVVKRKQGGGVYQEV